MKIDYMFIINTFIDNEKENQNTNVVILLSQTPVKPQPILKTVE